jgi:flagellar biosynthesis activator protein FlaF
MRTAAQTYAETAQATGNPRELEAQLLMRAAAKLQEVRAGKTDREIASAVRYNRRLWLIFAGAISRPDNPLPREIKQNVANLALFVVKHSMSLETSTAPALERLGVLININRELAAGLRARAA